MMHPFLPCGYNSDPNNGDEVDGAGTNWRVSPVLTDVLVAGFPLIITPEMLAVFNECPDLVIDCELDTIVIPAQDDVVEIAA